MRNITKNKASQNTGAQKALRGLRKSLRIREWNPRPHFLGVGTQKGGTTTLYELLKCHPDIYLPDNKEIHYFTKHYARGDRWYTEQFQSALPGQLRGEITPYYLFHEAAPQRIHTMRKRMKIIALLRNPVERTLSQYFHSCRWGLEMLNLEDALAAEHKRLAGSLDLISKSGGTHGSHQEHSYMSRSRYEQQLERYFRLFGRAHVLVLRSEDLFTGRPEFINIICNFLNISPFKQDYPIPLANQGKGEANQVPEKIRRQLRDELTPTFEWLDNNLGIRW